MSTPPIEMANLGMADSLILMVMALVVFGPRRLPQIGRQIGKLMYEFRKASNDFKFQMEEELRNAEDADRRKKEEEERQRALAAAPAPPQLEATLETAATETPAPAEDADTYTRGYESGEYGASAAEPQPEEIYPRIQPPSTGEPVQAGRPGSAPAEDIPASTINAHTEEGLELTPPAAAKPKARKPRAKKIKVEQESVVNEANPETEPASHHG